MNWGNLVATIFGALPMWIMAVEALHGNGNGAAKKQAVLELAGSTLNVVAGADPKLAPALQTAAPAIGMAVDGVVSTLNAFGVLNGPKTPAPAPAPQLVPAIVPAAVQANAVSVPVAPVQAPEAVAPAGGYQYGVPAHS